MTFYQTTAWGVRGASGTIERFNITRSDSKEYDVELDIYYCGVNQLDSAFIEDEYQNTMFPLVPGCEIAGRVSRIGKKVPNKFKVGDNVAVGLVVGSCKRCEMCQLGEEQSCDQDFTQVFNSNVRFGDNLLTDRKWTMGGFSSRISIPYRYVVKVPSNYPLEHAGTVMILGLASYGALKHWNARKGGLTVGVIGMGLLGLLTIEVANIMGNDVYAISSTDQMKDEAIEKGAREFLISSAEPFERNRIHRMDLIINTMSQPHDVTVYLPLLGYGGTIVQLGLIHSEPVEFEQFPSLMRDRLTIAGSFLGGMCDAQETMDFMAMHNIRVPVSLITCDQLDEAVSSLIQHFRLPERKVLDVRESYHILLGMENYAVLGGDEVPQVPQVVRHQGRSGRTPPPSQIGMPRSKTPRAPTVSRGVVRERLKLTVKQKKGTETIKNTVEIALLITNDGKKTFKFSR